MVHGSRRQRHLVGGFTITRLRFQNAQFLMPRQDYKEAGQQEKGIAQREYAADADEGRHNATDGHGNTCTGRKSHRTGEKGTQHSAAIHGERWEHVKDHHDDVDLQKTLRNSHIIVCVASAITT